VRRVVALLGLLGAARGGEVVPAAEELRWLEIPWRATLWDAVVDAHRLRRPILLWAMNGHPLACT
jgi:hypothetical protein